LAHPKILAWRPLYATFLAGFKGAIGVHRHPRRRVTEILGGIRSWGTKFKFGQLILRKIIKIVATGCHILKLKCTKFDSGWGSAPDPAGGAHRALRPYSWI